MDHDDVHAGDSIEPGAQILDSVLVGFVADHVQVDPVHLRKQYGDSTERVGHDDTLVASEEYVCDASILLSDESK